MMADLFKGAAGTPQKWNDAKEFGEMKARTAGLGDPQYNVHFDPANYQADFLGALDGHRHIIEDMFSAGTAPWSIVERGGLATDGSTVGLWARDNTNAVAVAWIYTVSDTNPPQVTVRDFTSVVPGTVANYSFEWIDPWTGESILAQPELVPLANIDSVDFWTNKMEQVLPTGFDNRQKEDVFVIIKQVEK